MFNLISNNISDSDSVIVTFSIYNTDDVNYQSLQNKIITVNFTVNNSETTDTNAIALPSSVTDIDKLISLSLLINSLANVVFPAPDGAEMINKFPNVILKIRLNNFVILYHYSKDSIYKFYEA